MNNNFFLELVNRLLSNNPKFFKWIQLAALVLGALSGVFSFLSGHNIDLPGWMEALSSWIVKLLTAITLLIAQLPNQDPKPIEGTK